MSRWNRHPEPNENPNESNPSQNSSNQNSPFPPMDQIYGTSVEYVLMATANRECFLAHINEGFTEDQSLQILRQLIETTMSTRMLIDEGLRIQMLMGGEEEPDES